MKWIWCFFLFFVLPLGASAADSIESIARYHFAGGASVLQDTNSTHLGRILRVPHGAKLKSRFLDRFSWEMASLGGVKDGKVAQQLKPLVEDLFYRESFGEWFRSDQLTFVFGIKLPEERVKVWKNTFTNFFVGEADGKEKAKLIQLPGGTRFQMTQSGGWLLFTSGLETAFKSTLIQLSRSEQPVFLLTNSWLRADINWALVPRNFPRPYNIKDCKSDVTLGSRGGDVRAVVKLTYPDAIKWSPSRWQIPTNLVGNPNDLVGFTAARNIAALVNVPSEFQKINPNPYTNQFFAWALPQLPFLTYAAMPVSKGNDLLPVFSRQLSQAFGNSSNFLFELKDDKSEIVWKGENLPRGLVRLTNSNSQTYLAGGFFAPVGKTNDLVSPLWREVAEKPNLIYYDWEITQPRIGTWWVLADFLPVLPPQETWAVGTRSAVGPWFESISPHIENTITEVTLTGPKEVTVVRRAPAIFTGLEIVKLSFWAAQKPKSP